MNTSMFVTTEDIIEFRKSVMSVILMQEQVSSAITASDKSKLNEQLLASLLEMKRCLTKVTGGNEFTIDESITDSRYRAGLDNEQ